MGERVKRALLLMICLGFGLSAMAGERTIGVLAMRGDAATLRHWQPLADSLNQRVPGEHFRIQPLDLSQMREAVNQKSIQFVLTNPAQFVQLNSHYYLRWLASLRSQDGNNIIGSVILVNRESKLQDPQDLISKTVGAIDPLAFGGYLTGYKALTDRGIRPEKDFRLRFTGFPGDALLYLLREKAIQAAIVPVCLLEQMDAEGLIDKTAFRPLMVDPVAAPCVTSTPLYPNWSFAALPDVDNALADSVARALLNNQQPPFLWGAPVSTSEVENLLRAVNQHPEQRRLWQEVRSWLIQNQFAVGVLILVVLLLSVNHIWIALLVRRRGRQLAKASETLRQQEKALENARQLSVLGEMASGFAHELNQPLSAIRHYSQGCLVRLRKTDEHHFLIPALEHIDAQAQRGGETLRNLRHWVQQPSAFDAAERESVTVSVRETAQRVADLLRLGQHYPGLTLFNQLPATLTLTLPPMVLDQLLANLILNAAQAGASAIWLTEQEGGIVVQDNAGGIDDAQLVHAFRPFNTTKPDGMGLGLAICQRLIRDTYGEITLDNHPAPDHKTGLRVMLQFSINDAKDT
ncbi:tetrathionate respiration histidine kinase TtrS [Atlantibacter hermannii]|uniref:tetrathionate respiration histidine kinase TtrS n=1 Tax=Atlantibacter hermannii TaxID=565 RepID=UPI001931C3D5|nr:tetrathionate respiration histidine kinase TtrS [Atlantibacter hermannii]MBL7637131.1 PhnD/SsuA/transferrin family substrate-binding protein [Atlantibacter hermannii]MBL7675677.1 PhnD/SsuA/transferrin family substrate-binding protein [Atlantibacter hermannii]